ncbi:MAG: YjgP/YjgQ family permease [Sediminibacterium sp. Gen4]|jgi:lipopolysaccharide export system permease protein|uniref:LptF/LptG family permease n=1 Tax=unclassified Sediminibacterium TaxID=2635961 RepID=UPI0015BE63B1|nr:MULTISPECIES: LptF/LptG family permease [unclassified Sediminibacterium]MBW0161715.1 LptF/LptG family permease [Sediminibacterium sp.]MBW0163135.1 LptF/LptG family permease [Sediminibacterium sp.]NWK67130.1 YjgP/YjgQ family permease [Sediminibacterium sp. Gen4]
MFKKLDILIIRSFVGPFLAAFAISLFVLTMQFFWLYIDDLVGKGLDFFTVMKLVGLVMLFWVPMALPLALLFSSIMTFGNLGESFELVAIKASGIPLLRFMRPLFFTTILLSGLAFLFSNNIIPVTQLKLAALKYDIIVSKPAIDIKEGVFYDKLDGYVIKLGKKEKNDSVIHDIVLFEKNYGLQDNMLMAETGIMRVTPDKKFLEFILKNGWRFEERGTRGTGNTEFIRLGFKEYKKIFDLSSFQMSKTGDSAFYDPKMLSLRQLNHAIDSLEHIDSFYLRRSRADITPYVRFARYAADTGWIKTDTLKLKLAKSFDALLPDSLRDVIIDASVGQISSIKSNVGLLASDYVEKYKSLRFHEIEWHRKFTLSVACIVLFLIGAPLGSIIRKGGLGTPLVFAIIFFVLFHLFNTFGEKFVKSGQASPMQGMWLSTLVLIPIGAFLTYKAMRDSQLFNQEFYYRTFTRLRKIWNNFRKNQERRNKNQEDIAM